MELDAQPTRVGVVGSRSYGDPDEVRRWIAALARKHPSAIVVSGGASGVDRIAETAACDHGLGVISFRPYSYDAITGRKEWSYEVVTEGDAAQAYVVELSLRRSPPYFHSFAAVAKHRNGLIVQHSHHVVAFWNGTSSGTRDTIDKARDAGKLRYRDPHEQRVLAEIEALIRDGILIETSRDR